MSDRCPMDWYCNCNFYGNAAINIVDSVVCVQRLSPQEKNVSFWFLKVVDIGNQRQRNTCDQLLIYARPWSLQ
jgi:hypothetical protein